MLFNWIHNVIKNYKKTMNISGEQCHKCNHYSYSFMGGGLAKIESCRKFHKEYVEDCPDFEQFCISDWDMCSYDTENGRYEK